MHVMQVLSMRQQVDQLTVELNAANARAAQCSSSMLDAQVNAQRLQDRLMADAVIR